MKTLLSVENLSVITVKFYILYRWCSAVELMRVTAVLLIIWTYIGSCHSGPKNGQMFGSRLLIYCWLHVLFPFWHWYLDMTYLFNKVWLVFKMNDSLHILYYTIARLIYWYTSILKIKDRQKRKKVDLITGNALFYASMYDKCTWYLSMPTKYDYNA